MVLTAQLQPQNMIPGGKIYIRGAHITSTYGPQTPGIWYGASDPNNNISSITDYFKITQTPAPKNILVTSSMWGYPDTTKLYAITGANAVLNELYDAGFRQIDIPNSQFNSITTPWSLKIADEFRFEGNENNTFMVTKVYGVGEIDNNRVSQTGSIEIQFDGNLPSGSINLDHFVIRRYVDGNYILVDGPKSTTNNGNGPFIIKPQYMSPKLDKGLDYYIQLLTERGLL
jgi:hypothetical protein